MRKWNRKLGTSKAEQGIETRLQCDAERERYIPPSDKYGHGKLIADKNKTRQEAFKKKVEKILVMGEDNKKKTAA